MEEYGTVLLSAVLELVICPDQTRRRAFVQTCCTECCKQTTIQFPGRGLNPKPYAYEIGMLPNRM